MDALGLANALIITDRYLLDSGAVDRLRNALGPSVRADVFADTVPDPTDTHVRAAADALLGGHYDSVVGFGGGSPMDTAKAAALLASVGGEMRDYRAPAVTNLVSMPVIAIPTTAGSGSECTRFTIITDTASNDKMLCAGLAFLPIAALVDYELTLSMPPRLSADTGVDALTHAIEAYVSRRANSFSDSMALSAMRTVYDSVLRVYCDPDDREAREAMMLAATQAGMAFSNSSVALVHGMSRPIGAHFHVAHGLSNAMLLPAVTAFSVGASPGRYANCARTLRVASDRDSDTDAGKRLVAALTELNAALNVPTPGECGIAAAEWERLIPLMAQQALASGSPSNNPRVPDAPEIEQLYREVWQ
jgi:alcohol dehydrogenase class IV